MNELLLSFIRWLKDPFHRKELAERHNVLLQHMYAARVVAHERADLIRGGNVFDNTLRGHTRRK